MSISIAHLLEDCGVILLTKDIANSRNASRLCHEVSIEVYGKGPNSWSLTSKLESSLSQQSEPMS